jgi:hypothetical protein
MNNVYFSIKEVKKAKNIDFLKYYMIKSPPVF